MFESVIFTDGERPALKVYDKSIVFEFNNRNIVFYDNAFAHLKELNGLHPRRQSGIPPIVYQQLEQSGDSV